MFTTLTYYNQNARSYTAATQTLDFRLIQDRFLFRMPRSARILDFGCGSGRDTRYFLNHGFQVDAVDGSSEMCRIAGEYTGIPIRQMLFQELDTVDTYDGIWACASILHLSRMELSDVFRRMAVALRKNGMIYASFKYGSFEGERNGRYFTDFTEKNFAEFVGRISELVIQEMWISGDVRSGRGEERWLNTILQKSAIR
ncbi:MAG TPA: class I SAM-dependent methyltransferase [Candidatus Eisenbergiella stercoravium]|nr:class I SAM-dependent methyltransferase [Candidatus Eisenbergiella stercoravium]